MPFMSEAQRRWFFANKNKYKRGSDPVKTLYAQNPRKINRALVEGKRIIASKPELAERIEEATTELKIIGDTQSRYRDSISKQYISERQKLHEEKINLVDNENAIPKKGKDPTVIFIGGLTASGKSTVIDKLVDHQLDETLPDYKKYKKYVYLNSDVFKEMLPEYEKYKGANAGMLHEESTDMLDKAVEKYTHEKKNIIIDATLKNTVDAKKNFAKFKSLGYNVILYGINIRGENSIIRAAKRAVATGRYVDLDYIATNAEKTNKSILTLRREAKLFKKSEEEPTVDKYKIVNNDVDFGKKPIPVESNVSLKRDRKNTSKIKVDSEAVWREKGVGKTDLVGYDDKDYVEIKDGKVKGGN